MGLFSVVCGFEVRADAKLGPQGSVTCVGVIVFVLPCTTFSRGSPSAP